MSIRIPCAFLATLILIAFANPATAGVYKCIDSDGSITYAQTPCPAQVSTAVRTSSSTPSADEEMQCDHAVQFSRVVARSMKRGKRSADLYAELGGFDRMSKSTVNIINYVYVYQHSTEIPEERIAELAGNKCKAHAFGDFSCEALPPAYIDRIGGCNEDAAEREPDAQLAARPFPEDDTLAMASPEPESMQAGGEVRGANAPGLEARTIDARDDCRDRAQNAIDRINAQMRAGYSSNQGERFRERLRSLRAQRGAC